ncbi:MAG: membrane protein insertion efficiency factor YidD [Bdellovibrionales bacterium]|nr:membrane protein insertion efficiency factor YidD [Bdellovibrionales bacterium]
MTAKWLVSNGLVSLYRKALSPILHAVYGPAYGCRFVPSCSEYFGNAVEAHGVLKGGAMGLRRICRCHPLGGSGFDPVPAENTNKG